MNISSSCLPVYIEPVHSISYRRVRQAMTQISLFKGNQTTKFSLVGRRKLSLEFVNEHADLILHWLHM